MVAWYVELHYINNNLSEIILGYCRAILMVIMYHKYRIELGIVFFKFHFDIFYS